MQVVTPGQGIYNMPVIWYDAPPGAKTYNGVSAFTSGIWDRDKPALPPELGAQPPYNAPYYKGANVWGYRGQCFIGTPEQFAWGLTLAEAIGPAPPLSSIPDCCRQLATVALGVTLGSSVVKVDALARLGVALTPVETSTSVVDALGVLASPAVITITQAHLGVRVGDAPTFLGPFASDIGVVTAPIMLGVSSLTLVRLGLTAGPVVVHVDASVTIGVAVADRAEAIYFPAPGVIASPLVSSPAALSEALGVIASPVASQAPPIPIALGLLASPFMTIVHVVDLAVAIIDDAVEAPPIPIALGVKVNLYEQRIPPPILGVQLSPEAEWVAAEPRIGFIVAPVMATVPPLTEQLGLLAMPRALWVAAEPRLGLMAGQVVASVPPHTEQLGVRAGPAANVVRGPLLIGVKVSPVELGAAYGGQHSLGLLAGPRANPVRAVELGVQVDAGPAKNLYFGCAVCPSGTSSIWSLTVSGGTGDFAAFNGVWYFQPSSGCSMVPIVAGGPWNSITLSGFIATPVVSASGATAIPSSVVYDGTSATACNAPTTLTLTSSLGSGTRPTSVVASPV